MNADLTASAGCFDVRHGADVVIRQATACARMSDGSLITLANPATIAEPTLQGWRAVAPGSVQRPTMWLDIKRSGEHLILCAGLRNTTDQSLILTALAPLVTSVLDLGAPLAEWSFYRMGWQSWSPAGTTAVADDRLPSAPPVVSPATGEMRNSDLTTPWGAILRGRPDRLLLIGFTTALRQTSTVRLTRSGELWAVCDLEDVHLSPGETVESEALLVTCGAEADTLLRIYGRAIASAMQARPVGHSLSGWCTWYQYYGAVQEDHVLDNLQRLKAEGRAGAIQVVQLDAGYEAAVGDWLTPNSKFPHGLKWLAGQIRAAGFKPGLWLAPFTVSPGSQLFADHPEWVIRDEDGAPLPALRDFDWEVELHGLDCTHPAALKWLANVVRTVVSEWGFEYLKLDFLYSGALRGQRYATGVTAIEAYRQGLSLIREVAGDVFIVGCGAPLLPSVGLVDAMRIGPDIAPFWKPKPKDTYRVWPSAENAVRNTLARYWMHGHLWQNDADCLLVRDHDTQLTEAEAQTWATLVGLSGGLVMWSDGLADLSPARARLIDVLLPPIGQAAQPMGLLDAEKPVALALTIERPFGSWRVVTLFNWEDDARVIEYDLGGPGYVYEFWSRTYHGRVLDRLQLAISPHGCALISVRTPLSRPQLVGSTFHITLGGGEIAEESWDAGRRALTVRLRVPGQRRGRLVFAWPDGYRLTHVSAPLADLQTAASADWLELDGILFGEATLVAEFDGSVGAERLP